MKKLTHVLAAVLVGAAGFFATHAGAALVAQYPILTAVSTLVGVAALYFNPKK